MLERGLKPLPSFKLDIKGDHGVVLETIKRGEDDFEAGYTVERHDGRAVLLRLHEGIGGAARGTLKVYVLKQAAWVSADKQDWARNPSSCVGEHSGAPAGG